MLGGGSFFKEGALVGRIGIVGKRHGFIRSLRRGVELLLPWLLGIVLEGGLVCWGLGIGWLLVCLLA